MGKKNLSGKIKGVEIKKPSECVLEQLRELLLSGELQSGDILPSERELAVSFGIGRGYIREAIKTLELYGIFHAVPGVGTVVSDMGLDAIGKFLHNLLRYSAFDLHELLESRLLIEPYMAFQATRSATAKDLERIKNTCKNMRNIEKRGQVDLSLESDFHKQIAQATHSCLLTKHMWAILPGLINILNELDLISDGRLCESHDEHEKIVEAMIAKKPLLAAERMQNHIENTIRHYSANCKSRHLEVDFGYKQNASREYFAYVKKAFSLNCNG